MMVTILIMFSVGHAALMHDTEQACWTLSNIAAGSVSQIQSVLDSGAMPQLIKVSRFPPCLLPVLVCVAAFGMV